MKISNATMNRQGRVVIPADIRKEMGLGDTAELVFRYDDGVVTMMTLERAVGLVQEVASRYIASDGSLVDQFVADRHDEASAE